MEEEEEDEDVGEKHELGKLWRADALEVHIHSITVSAVLINYLQNISMYTLYVCAFIKREIGSTIVLQ